MSTALVDEKPKASQRKLPRGTFSNPAGKFLQHQSKLIRLQKALISARTRGDDAEVDKICDEHLNSIASLAREIADLPCADLHQLHVKAQYVLEFLDGDGILAELVSSICRDIDVLWRCVEVSKKKLNRSDELHAKPANSHSPAKRGTKRQSKRSTARGV